MRGACNCCSEDSDSGRRFAGLSHFCVHGRCWFERVQMICIRAHPQFDNSGDPDGLPAVCSSLFAGRAGAPFRRRSAAGSRSFRTDGTPCLLGVSSCRVTPQSKSPRMWVARTPLLRDERNWATHNETENSYGFNVVVSCYVCVIRSLSSGGYDARRAQLSFLPWLLYLLSAWHSAAKVLVVWSGLAHIPYDCISLTSL